MQIAEWSDTAIAGHRRALIEKLVRACVCSPNSLGPDDVEVRHHFAPGAYAREMHMPAGIVLVGKIHKHAHLNTLSKGKVRVFTEHGGIEEFTAPHTYVSPRGTQRAFHVLEDAVWTTFHVTDSTDLAAIERETVVTDYKDLQP